MLYFVCVDISNCRDITQTGQTAREAQKAASATLRIFWSVCVASEHLRRKRVIWFAIYSLKPKEDTTMGCKPISVTVFFLPMPPLGTMMFPISPHKARSEIRVFGL